LAIGTEKLYDEDRGKVMRSFTAGTDVEETMARIAQWQAEEKRQKEQEAKENCSKAVPEKPGGHSYT
jgi:uncharacterized small protein (DUF1192 family)